MCIHVVYTFYHADGHLLGVDGYKLMKYKVENGKLTTVWTCKDVTDGDSVCSDPDDLIHVGTTDDVKAVYIISPEGN